MNINFDKDLQNLIDENIKNNTKPKILLHSCCAPCSSSSIERLAEGFDVIVYYYNPNMDTEDEFYKRAREQQRYCKELNVDCIVEKYNSEEFFSKLKGYEKFSEGGERCFICYKLRLKKTAEKAKEKGIEYFATTLTLSPLKNSAIINLIGEEVEKEVGVKYLATDFKKRNGYLRSIELSKKYDLYRQNYCGCVYSKAKEN